MARFAQHHNGCMLCAIDIDTTGPDPWFHEILNIAIIPLDSEMRPSKEVLPYALSLTPEYPERIAKATKKIVTSTEHSMDKMSAIDLFDKWVEKLKLPTTKWGTPKKIMPLSHSYVTKQPFITRWMTQEFYDIHFSSSYRDTQVTAAYLNDQTAFHGRVVPYSKIELSWVAHQCHVEHRASEGVLQRARTCAETYRALCGQGLF